MLCINLYILIMLSLLEVPLDWSSQALWFFKVRTKCKTKDLKYIRQLNLKLSSRHMFESTNYCSWKDSMHTQLNYSHGVFNFLYRRHFSMSLSVAIFEPKMSKFFKIKFDSFAKVDISHSGACLYGICLVFTL